MKIHRKFHLLALMTVLTIFSLALTREARACTGASCEKKDPIAEGCTADEVVLGTEVLYDTYGARTTPAVGLAMLTVSYSPTCKAKWGTIEAFDDNATMWFYWKDPTGFTYSPLVVPVRSNPTNGYTFSTPMTTRTIQTCGRIRVQRPEDGFWSYGSGCTKLH